MRVNLRAGRALKGGFSGIVFEFAVYSQKHGVSLKSSGLSTRFYNVVVGRLRLLRWSFFEYVFQVQRWRSRFAYRVVTRRLDRVSYLISVLGNNCNDGANIYWPHCQSMEITRIPQGVWLQCKFRIATDSAS